MAEDLSDSSISVFDSTAAEGTIDKVTELSQHSAVNSLSDSAVSNDKQLGVS